MNYVSRCILSLILLSSSFLVLYGINWGLPSAERKALVMPPGRDVPSFYETMKQTRDDIYRIGGGSPVGRLYGANVPGLTPVLVSMNMTSPETVVVNTDEKVLANFIRPYLLRSHHPDEQMTIASLALMHPGSCDFYPRIFCYGGAYIYTVGAALETGRLLHLVKIDHDLGFYFANPGEMARIFVVGRGINAVFMPLTVFIVFMIGRRLYSLRAGLLSAALVAANPSILFEAHVMKPYMMASMFSVACLYFSFSILRDPAERRNYLAAGVFAGLTAGILSFFGYIILAPLTAHFLSSGRSRKNLLYLMIVPAAVFLLVNPYWVIKFRDMRLEMLSSRSVYASAVSLPLLKDFFLAKLSGNLSYPLVLLYVLGALLALKRRDKEDVLMLVSTVVPLFIFAFLLQNQETNQNVSRFFLPWVAAFSILGARTLDRIIERSSFKPAAGLVIAVLLAPSLIKSYLIERNYAVDGTLTSTRAAAGKWITDNIPAGSVIGLDGLPEPYSVPPFDFTRYRIAPLKNHAEPKSQPLDYFIAKGNSQNKPDDLNENYALLKRFEPAGSQIGVFFGLLPSHVNSEMLVYKRNDGRQ